MSNISCNSAYMTRLNHHPYHIKHEDGGIMFLQDTGINLQHHTM